MRVSGGLCEYSGQWLVMRGDDEPDGGSDSCADSCAIGHAVSRTDAFADKQAHPCSYTGADVDADSCAHAHADRSAVRRWPA